MELVEVIISYGLKNCNSQPSPVVYTYVLTNNYSLWELEPSALHSCTLCTCRVQRQLNGADLSILYDPLLVVQISQSAILTHCQHFSSHIF